MTVGSWIAGRRSLWERRLGQLADYLARTSGKRPRDPGSEDQQQQSDQPLEEKQ